MIKVVSKGYFYVDKIDEALKLYEKLIPATRAERGCVGYNLYQDIEDKAVLTMIEEWEDEDCLKAHFEAVHFKELVPQIASLRIKSELNKYVVLM